MNTQTIVVDNEAYDLLARARRGDESFSETIKRIARPASGPPARPMRTLQDFQALMAEIDANPMSDAAIEAIEQVIAQRRSPANCRDPWAADPDKGHGQ